MRLLFYRQNKRYWVEQHPFFGRALWMVYHYQDRQGVRPMFRSHWWIKAGKFAGENQYDAQEYAQGREGHDAT